ncbi:MAG: 2TM domain-containing protein [Leptolyngbyaceae cyanobacterium SL_7_1]|nr:2TM domain-containing protein [Leptolyngbyaceae cyanobacterium SL_7_1]
MPPRWSRKPDRNDPDYRKLDDRMNFALHVAIFAATNSGLWFFRVLQAHGGQTTIWITTGWLLVLIAHAVFIFAIADYSPSSSPTQPPS